MKRLELKGKYGRLTVLHTDGNTKSGHVLWLCRCDCGVEKRFSGYRISSGHTKSCGCLSADMAREKFVQHIKNIWNKWIMRIK